jgi:integrase
MPRRSRGWKVWVEPSGKNQRCRWSGKYGTGQHTFVFKSDARDLAETKRRDFQRQDSGMTPMPRAVRVLTLGEAADEYLAYAKKEKAHRTFRNFDTPAVASIRSFIGSDRQLASIEPADVQKWKHSLPDGTTAAMHFRQARAFFNYMVKLKRLTESPAKGLAKPQEGPGGRALTDDELTRLMPHAPDKLRRASVFSLNTMFRIDEVVRFDWAWVVDLPGDQWLARLPWQIRKTRRKVKKDCIVPLNATARSVMGKRQASGRVFPWPASTLQHQMTAPRASAGLPDDVSFHSFRHTGATRYLAAGGHMEDLLENGSGLWTDPRSLLRYVHVDPLTLVPRFAGLKYPRFGPHPAPKSEKPPTHSGTGG